MNTKQVQTPQVSIVMGVYNNSAHLKETVESVLQQSFADFEFIIVNDGSEDDSLDVLRDYEQNETRIRIIDKQNEGLTKALIDGCEAARGQYIARIDLGDTMSEHRLQKQVDVFSQHGMCDLVTSDVGFFAPDWELLWITESAPRSESSVAVISDSLEKGLECDIAHHGSVMFRTSAYRKAGGYRQEFYYGQDWDLWYRLAEQGQFYVIPEVLYRSRYFPNAISMSQSEKQRKIASLSLEAHIRRKKGESDEPSLESASQIRPSKGTKTKTRSEDGNYFIGEALRRNGNASCRSYFRESIRRRPLQVKSYIRLIQTL